MVLVLFGHVDRPTLVLNNLIKKRFTTKSKFMAGRKRRLLSVAAGSWHSENVDENTKLTDILH